MGKKIAGFNLINNNLPTCTSLLHKLSSSEFWLLRTEYSTSSVKHNFTLKTNQFIDVRCKKWGDLTIFSKSSTVIFSTIGACAKVHKYLSVMASGNDYKYYNMIES